MENKLEVLSKDLLLPLLQERADELDAIAKVLAGSLKKSPDGFLSISPHYGTYQYYHVDAKRRETYIPKRDRGLAAALAQRDYNRGMLTEVSALSQALRKCLAKYSPHVRKMEAFFGGLHPARRALIRPLLLPDDEFVRTWEAAMYEGKRFVDGDELHVTSRGERVRSKSEIIIADTLFRLQVPYRYECPLLLKKAARQRAVRFYPDFTCLNVRTRQEVVWEHFGLMDDPAYAGNMVAKLDLYALNDFYLGQNLIITCETRTKHLNPGIVEKLARRILM